MTAERAPDDPREQIIAYLPDMRAFAISLTRNQTTADDLLQDAVIKAWTNFHQFQSETNLRAWLFTILRNTFYSDLRKKRRENSHIDISHAASFTTETDRDPIIDVMDFEKAFSLLPPEQREALMLVGGTGMSYEDAAATCGVAIGTIKSRINRGRKRLATLLSPKDDAAPKG